MSGATKRSPWLPTQDWTSSRSPRTLTRRSARYWTSANIKYEEQKKKNEARKKQKIIEVKEIKLRPSIDDHDYDVKMRSMVKFLEEGDKVKVTMRFRGRELAHQELGMDVLIRVRDNLQEIAKVEQMPRMEGRQMTMVMSPK